MGPVLAYGSQPNPENETAATAHLTFEGMRDTYLRGVPSDVAARIPAESWEGDWRVMQLPGRMDKERALIADYARYVARFDVIAEYLKRWQPRALMVWGRHEPFFELAEVLSWMEDLPRMEAHILDGGHMLLETHAAEAASLVLGEWRATKLRAVAADCRYRRAVRHPRRHPRGLCRIRAEPRRGVSSPRRGVPGALRLL